jgi:hypothetical protein
MEKQVQKYQREVKDNALFVRCEQKWIDDNFQPLVDFMGYEEIWKCMVPNIELYGLDGKKSARNIPPSKNPQAHFSSTHWNSRKPGELYWFDPYNEYQVQGTNQFCQTFCMMNLVGALPPISADRSWTKFYIYTQAALQFIEFVVNKCVSNQFVKKKYLEILNNCKTSYAICLNAIEV